MSPLFESYPAIIAAIAALSGVLLTSIFQLLLEYIRNRKDSLKFKKEKLETLFLLFECWQKDAKKYLDLALQNNNLSPQQIVKIGGSLQDNDLSSKNDEQTITTFIYLYFPEIEKSYKSVINARAEFHKCFFSLRNIHNPEVINKEMQEKRQQFSEKVECFKMAMVGLGRNL